MGVPTQKVPQQEELLQHGKNPEKQASALVDSFYKKNESKYKNEDQQTKKELRNRIMKNAECAFTYQKLVDGLKTNKFKKVVIQISDEKGVCLGSGQLLNGGLDSETEQFMIKNKVKMEEELFNIEYFREKPEVFYKYAK